MEIKRLYCLALCAILPIASIGCGAMIGRQEKSVVMLQPQERPEGVEDYIWEEPMVDVVEVPPGLDPEGHYYRPGHQEVVEIRQGRWRLKEDK